ncbi:MAG TPA: hypothetical protein VGI40_16160 [Pirellulaceae bacterium]|jgi:hypothetical protein
MCCFTGVVQWVAGTKIFAKPWRDGSQFLAYGMSVHFKDELAMVLPIPVPKNSDERAVGFINLKGYPEFFRDMAKGFPAAGSTTRGGIGGVVPAAAAPRLEVHEVGNFEASFVPKIADFARLDARFRLADGVWDQLPDYVDYGFAVFKLKLGKENVHAMAFSFPRADRKQIFFPTVHIHDGKVHATAEFDHVLYFQLSDADYSPKHGWTESTVPAGMFMNMQKIGDYLDAGLHCYRREIRGRQKNADVWV